MANYAYIFLPQQIIVNDFEEILKKVVDQGLGDKWQVRQATYDYDGVTWEVFIPGTACDSEATALQKWLALGEDLLFPVAVDVSEEGTNIVFRHSMHPLARWAQGCLEESLATYFDEGVFYDATDETLPPSTRRYSKYSTFKEYALRGFPKPLSAEDKSYLDERYASLVPEGFWD